MRNLLKIAIISALAVGTAACFGDDDKQVATTPTPPAPTPPAPTPRFSELGAGFAAAFAVGANAEPREVTGADLGAVSLTTEPANVS